MFKPFKYKDRPDLTPDAPRKKGVFLFWELYVRKFWKLVTVNMLYFVFTLPMLVYGLYFLSQILGSVEQATDLLPGVAYISVLLSPIPNSIFLIMLAISVICYGPFTMGATYIYRNFAREEHVWISDFFSRAWRNAFQGVVFGLLDIAVTLSLILTAVGGVTAEGGITLFTSGVFVQTLARIGIVFWMIIRKYIYLYAVTFKLNLFLILKNCIILMIGGIGYNALSLVFNAIVIVICFLLHPLVTVVTLPFLFYSFTGFLTIFTVYPVFKLIYLDPAIAKENPPEEDESEEITIEEDEE